jgi:putative tryptophan/tyrosine transport system substrate-binding protein
MLRREFIAGFAGAAVWPLAARAQQPALPVVGFLNQQTAEQSAEQLRSFRQGLNQTG